MTLMNKSQKRKCEWLINMNKCSPALVIKNANGTRDQFSPIN